MSEADWSSEEHVRIVCELFAEQVNAGNRSSTHLNNVGFKHVIEKFKEKTGIEYTRLQFKNKWSKLRIEYSCWKTLLKQTGLGWDERKQNIDVPESWWKKARKDIPGCGKFKGQRLQNENGLKIMFEDIRNTGDDHFCASSGLISEESPLINLDVDEDDNEGDVDSNDEEEEEVTPPLKDKGKRAATAAANDKVKRPKSSGGIWMQEQVGKILTSVERSAASVQSIAARKVDDTGMSIKEVMAVVKACGAAPGTKQFFIASELFTKKEEREMFTTMDTPQERFEWLTMKHFVKYGH